MHGNYKRRLYARPEFPLVFPMSFTEFRERISCSTKSLSLPYLRFVSSFSTIAYMNGSTIRHRDRNIERDSPSFGSCLHERDAQSAKAR